MQQRQIKSAPPGRVRSKKTSALAEIEEWVNSSTELVNGKSKEQRLLRAKLLELGKERFKVKAKVTYDLRKFMDKQTRKGLLNKRARPVSAHPNTTMEPASGRGKRAALSQSAPVNRTESQMKKKTVQFQLGSGNGEYLTTGVVDSGDDMDGAFISLNPDSSPNARLPAARARPSTAATPLYGSRSTPSEKTPVVSQNNARFIKENKLCKFGGKLPSVVSDPRFSGLHKSLSENHECTTKDSVLAIIQRKESLRKPLKTGGKEARRELELKIKQFMEERNIVF